jgi:PLP dependent protein
MAELIRGLDPDRVRARLAEVRAEVGERVEVLAAVKYVATEELGVLAEAGVRVVGENRAQALQEKVTAYGSLFTWDFIGHVQSRKVRQILPLVRLVHGVATDSVVAQLARHATPATEILVEVNVAREPGKSGVDPGDLDAFLERCEQAGARVGGLMTMPPLARDPEDSRRWFAALAQLAADRGLERLSMGTTQDYAVAAQEGATIVRIGTKLFR